MLLKKLPKHAYDADGFSKVIDYPPSLVVGSRRETDRLKELAALSENVENADHVVAEHGAASVSHCLAPEETVAFRAGVDEAAKDVKKRVLGIFDNVKSAVYDDVFNKTDTITLDAESGWGVAELLCDGRGKGCDWRCL